MNAGPAEDAQLDPCTLVTAADAEHVLGAPVDQPQRAANDVNAVCIYRARRGSPPPSLSLQLTEATSEEAASAALRDAKEGLAGLAPEELSGVGDEAFWMERMKQLHARKGNVWFTLVGDAPRTALVELARVIVARLP